MPVLIDITAPQNPYAVINHGAFMTNSPDVVVTISATDLDTGVGAYFISESPLTPMAGTPGWVEVTSAIKFGATIPFILSPADGQKTIYVWFKDIGGNVSTPASTTILVNTSGYLCVAKWGSLAAVHRCCTAENSWRRCTDSAWISRDRCLSWITATIAYRNSTARATLLSCGEFRLSEFQLP